MLLTCLVVDLHCTALPIRFAIRARETQDLYAMRGIHAACALVTTQPRRMTCTKWSTLTWKRSVNRISVAISYEIKWFTQIQHSVTTKARRNLSIFKTKEVTTSRNLTTGIALCKQMNLAKNDRLWDYIISCAETMKDWFSISITS